MKRRSFLTGLVGVLAAPAVVRAESLMKLWAPPRGFKTTEFWWENGAWVRQVIAPASSTGWTANTASCSTSMAWGDMLSKGLV